MRIVTNSIGADTGSVSELRRDAAEAGLIRDLATDQKKRETFDRVCQHLNSLADEVERATPTNDGEAGSA
jgi:hypothetical protein